MGRDGRYHRSAFAHGLPTGSPTTSTTRLPPSPDREVAILSYLILPSPSSPPCLPLLRERASSWHCSVNRETRLDVCRTGSSLDCPAHHSARAAICRPAATTLRPFYRGREPRPAAAYIQSAASTAASTAASEWAADFYCRSLPSAPRHAAALWHLLRPSAVPLCGDHADDAVWCTEHRQCHDDAPPLCT